jgi:hypothetical protein
MANELMSALIDVENVMRNSAMSLLEERIFLREMH